MTLTSIHPEDGVTLATALAVHAARTAELRVFAIKGQQLANYGLRSRRVSSDVDIWVEPGGFEQLISALALAGWVERPRWRLSDIMTTHSISLLHPEWPCDIDVHHEFPGFLAPTGQVFEALWERHTQLDFAGIQCNVPDRAASAIILALHSLRSSAEDPRHRLEYKDLVSILRRENDQDFLADLSALAAATGSAGTLAPFLRAVGAEVPPHDEHDPELIAWIAHVNGGNDVTAVFLERWRETPWRARPRVLWWALWPSADELRQARQDPDLRGTALLRARYSRIGRAAASVPHALRARRRAQRGERASGYDAGGRL